MLGSEYPEFVQARPGRVSALSATEYEMSPCFPCRTASFSCGHVCGLHQDERIWHGSLVSPSMVLTVLIIKKVTIQVLFVLPLDVIHFVTETLTMLEGGL